MAVVLVDGFDLYNGTGLNTGLQAKWSVSASGHSMISGRFGGQALRITAGTSNAYATRAFPGNYASFAVGFGMRVTSFASLTGPYPMCSFQDSTGTIQCGFRVTTAGALEAYRYTSDSSGTSLGVSASGVMIANAWHFVECEVTINDTTGVFKIYVDGVQVLNLTAQDTKNTANANAGLIRFGAAANISQVFDIDDLYVTDTAAKLGERRVETLYPTSDVAQGFARSTGAVNFSLVDEAQVNGDTDYVQGSTVGDVDTYGFSDLTGTPATIDAVQVSCFALKTDATSRSIALQVKSGATTSDGSNFALAASYGKFERLLLTDPNTAAAWTAANVNAVQGGPKVTV
jgi:hypothetical protein